MTYEINTVVSTNEKESYQVAVSSIKDQRCSDRDYIGYINRLNREYDIIAAPYDRENRRVAIKSYNSNIDESDLLDNPIPKIEFLTEPREERFSLEDDKHPLKLLVLRSLRKSLAKDYTVTQTPGFRHAQCEAFTTSFETDKTAVFSGFRFTADVMQDKIVIHLDPRFRYRFTETLAEKIDDIKGRDRENQHDGIVNELQGLNVHIDEPLEGQFKPGDLTTLLDNMGSGKVVDIDFSKTCGDKLAWGQSLVEYTEQEFGKKYASRIDEKNPVIKVEQGSSTYSYPPTRLRVVANLENIEKVEDRETYEKIQNMARMKPKKRYNFTNKYVRKIKSTPFGGTELKFERSTTECDVK